MPNQNFGKALQNLKAFDKTLWLRDTKERHYIRSMIHKYGEIDEDLNYRIRIGWMKWRNISRVLYDRRIPIKLKGNFYKTTI